MENSEKIEAYYAVEHHFKNGIAVLRDIALKTDVTETYKWNFPVYTVEGKNVFGICKFKSHFGIWFFNGALLSDPLTVLENAQEGKTKAMRHWKFTSIEDIDEMGVLNYIREAIENQKNGRVLHPTKSKKEFAVPALLEESLNQNTILKAAFENFSPYKQKEFCEYINEAKQEKTKLKRLEKILPLIDQGIGLNDKYR